MRRLLFVGVALLVVACAEREEAPPYSTPVGPGSVVLRRMTVEPERTSMRLPIARPPGRLWTVHGLAFTELWLIDGLEAGRSLDFSLRRWEKAPPFAFRAMASGPELAQLLLDSVRAKENDVEVVLDSLRSAAFAGGEGIRVDVRFRRQPRGLPMRRLGVARAVDGRLYAILFIAPEDHYFPTYLPAAERIIQSARLLR